MQSSLVHDRIEELLCLEFHCTPGDLHGSRTVCTVHPGEAPFVRILSYKRALVISASPGLQELVCAMTHGRTKDEIFELPIAYGMTIHYVPDYRKFTREPYVCSYELESFHDGHIAKLAGISGFDHALAFGPDGTTSTRTAVAAMEGDRIVGLAGAAPSPVDGVWEVGIEVTASRRRNGIASCLVRTIASDLEQRGILPFYSSSATNIASQCVAVRCGFLPLWVDTYGTVRDDRYPYSLKDIQTLLQAVKMKI